MADTLPNIPLDSNEWIDLYDQSGISVGRKVKINNVGDSDVYYSVSQSQPSLNNTSYKVISPRDLPVTTNQGDSGLWALSPTDNGKVNVELYIPVDPQAQRTAFGELSVAEPTPEVQISAVAGLRDDVQQIFAGAGSSVAAVLGNYECVSGTSPSGLSSILSARPATYRNGQGLVCEITALFEDDKPDSIQLAGFINGNNAFAFGFENASYGIVRAFDGVTEFQELQVTSAATGSENATITVDGTGFTVPLTSGSVEHNAFEISNSLNVQVPNYSFSANGDTVSALAAIPIAAGSFAFSSATAIAIWTQINIGTPATFDFVPEADWTHPPVFTIDPTKGNVYQIKIQYLGYGGIKFYIENPDTTEFDLVHIYKYSNANVRPSVNNPTFRVGWVAQNLGNTLPITVRGASATGFVEGKKVFDERGRGLSAENTALNTTRVNLLSIRNRLHMNNSINRISIYPKSLIASADHNKTVILHMDIGATFSTDLIFEYLDQVNSAVEFSDDPAIVATDGREIATIRLRSTTPIVLDLQKFLDVLLPRETLTISAETSQGVGAEVDASIVWVEDP